MTLQHGRRLLLLGCAVFLTACASTPKNGDVQTVLAEGTGNTCQEALGQAKVQASDKAVGSFVNSQKSLVADKYYAESINEYSGGVVRQYTVLESKGDSPVAYASVPKSRSIKEYCPQPQQPFAEPG